MKKNAGQLANEIYGLLEGQSIEDSERILSSVKVLLGFELPVAVGTKADFQTSMANNQNAPQSSTRGAAQGTNAKSYFEHKDPKNKGEEFAVAAMYRQENGLGDVHRAEDLKAVIKTQAKRKFDENNFVRDMKNAVRQAKYFIGGDTKGEYLLSSLGENYVNALPDRTAANQAKKAAKGSRKAKKKPRPK